MGVPFTGIWYGCQCNSMQATTPRSTRSRCRLVVRSAPTKARRSMQRQSSPLLHTAPTGTLQNSSAFRFQQMHHHQAALGLGSNAGAATVGAQDPASAPSSCSGISGWVNGSNGIMGSTSEGGISCPGRCTHSSGQIPASPLSALAGAAGAGMQPFGDTAGGDPDEAFASASVQVGWSLLAATC